MIKNIDRYITRRVLLGAVAISIGLCFFWVGMLWLFRPQNNAAIQPTAAFTVIPVPITDVTATPSQMITSTPTPNPTVQSGGIGVGVYVQITGTGGDGLRLRTEPGTNSKAQFIGMESEVFRVQDGPKEADDFTWWYLVSPYDDNRSGWAAASYLIIIASQ